MKRKEKHAIVFILIFAFGTTQKFSFLWYELIFESDSQSSFSFRSNRSSQSWVSKKFLIRLLVTLEKVHIANTNLPQHQNILFWTKCFCFLSTHIWFFFFDWLDRRGEQWTQKRLEWWWTQKIKYWIAVSE
jgi:hypothetical protein